MIYSLACDWLLLVALLLGCTVIAYVIAATAIAGLLEDLWLTDRSVYYELLAGAKDSWIERGFGMPHDLYPFLRTRKYLLNASNDKVGIIRRRTRYRVFIRIAISSALLALAQLLLCLVHAVPRMHWM